MDINKKIIKFNTSIRGTEKIKYIVIHDTGNVKIGADAENHYKYFSGGDRQASAHYFVDDKQVLQIIEDDKASWHVGDGNGRNGITNRNSIGIEICVNPDSLYDVALQKTIELINFLMEKHNIPKENVVRHFDASGKICPKSMSKNNWAKWNEFYSNIGNVNSKVTISVHGKLIKVDGYFVDEKNYVSVRGLCEALGYKVGWKDGVVTLEK